MIEPNPTQARERPEHSERILKEAANLFVQRGYDGVSMREIAEACSLSKAGIYYHFKDKEDLFIALLNANLDQLTALLAQACQDNPSARQRLSQFSQALFTQMDHNQRAMIRIASQEMNKLSPSTRSVFSRRYQTDFIDALAAIFAEGVRQDELRPVDPNLATWVLLGMLYPFFAPGGDAHPQSALNVVEGAMAIFFHGILHETPDKGKA
jgi:AcrR family transcriptional regulator